MASNQKTIFVYDDFSSGSPILMGTLYVNIIKGGESYSFEYDKDWLKKTSLKLTLDPELMPYSGRQYPTGKTIFGLFADASPDRWGRVLMKNVKESWQKRKDANHLSCTTATICWEYTTKHEWAAFDLKQIRMAHFFLMTKKQLLLLGQRFAH